jgi:hypothetical protein
VRVLVHVPLLKSHQERVRTRVYQVCEAMVTVLLLTASVGMGIYTYLAG